MLKFGAIVDVGCSTHAVKKNWACSLIPLINFRQFNTRMDAAVPRVSFTANLQRHLSAPAEVAEIECDIYIGISGIV